MLCLLIGLGNIFWVRRMDGHDAQLFEEAVQAGDRVGKAPFSKLDPEDNKAGVGIEAVHIRDERDFLWGMLVTIAEDSFVCVLLW